MSDLISRQAVIDVLEERLQANGYSNVALVSELNRIIGYLMQLPSAQPEPNYCRDCKWSQCHINVDKHGETEMYWRCLNWDGETNEEGYCHEWERRSDGQIRSD